MVRALLKLLRHKAFPEKPIPKAELALRYPRLVLHEFPTPESYPFVPCCGRLEEDIPPHLFTSDLKAYEGPFGVCPGKKAS